LLEIIKRRLCLKIKKRKRGEKEKQSSSESFLKIHREEGGRRWSGKCQKRIVRQKRRGQRVKGTVEGGWKGVITKITIGFTKRNGKPNLAPLVLGLLRKSQCVLD